MKTKKLNPDDLICRALAFPADGLLALAHALQRAERLPEYTNVRGELRTQRQILALRAPGQSITLTLAGARHLVRALRDVEALPVVDADDRAGVARARAVREYIESVFYELRPVAQESRA